MTDPKRVIPTRLTVSGGPQVKPRLLITPEPRSTPSWRLEESPPTPLIRTRLTLLMGLLIVVGIAIGVAYVVGQVLS